MHFDKFLTNDILEDRHIYDVAPLTTFYFCHKRQIDLILACICSVADFKRCENVIRTSLTHVASLWEPYFFVLMPHFDIICDLLLNRCMQYGIYQLKSFFKL